MLPPKLSLFAIVLLTSGCIQPSQFDDEYEAQFEGNTQRSTELFASGYFPKSYGEPSTESCGDSSPPRPLIGEYEGEWYPREWMAAREPSFFLLSENDASPDFALRFTYLPSFNASVFIRVHKSADKYILIAKRMSRYGGDEPDSIASSKRIELSSKQSSELKRLLDEEGLFEEPADYCGFGFDGSRWIFERVGPQGYSMVKRWSPTNGAGFNLGEYMYTMTGWSLHSSCLRPLPYPFEDIEFACR
ncbi:hypothetical protein [Erythrobacter sp. Alg231-14]|uniref:hypothetical protein n=1 Tax=Erythrobacter sp. Alg231-14 TaxID=1922225 RepID=UPI000D55531E